MDAEALLRCARGYQEAGKSAQALPLFARAATMLAPTDPREAAEAWRQAGRCAATVFEHDTAADFFRRAIDLLADVPGREAHLARLHSNLAGACYAACRFRDAEAAARKALELADLAGDVKTAAAALYNLGLAVRYRGRLREALRHFLQARRLYRLAGQAARATDALHNAGWVCVDLHRFQQAQAELERARAEKLASGELEGRIDVELARLHLKQGDAVGALTRIRRVLDSAEPHLDPVTHVQTLIVAAEAEERDAPQAGLEIAVMALDLALSLGRPPVLVDLLPVLVRLRQRAGQPLSERERALLRQLTEEVENLAHVVALQANDEGEGDEHDAVASSGRAGSDRSPGIDNGWGNLGERRSAAWQTDGELYQSGLTRRDQVRPQSGDRQGAGGTRRQGARRSGRPGSRLVVDDLFATPTGQEIRSRRLALGWTQEELAERAGFEVTTVKRAERGARVPEHTLRALGMVLGLGTRANGRLAVQYWKHLGEAHEALGELGQARFAYTRAANTSHGEGDLAGEAVAAVQLARLDLREGKVNGVVGRLVRCRQICASLGDRIACWQVDCLLAEAQVASGNPVLVIPVLERLLREPGATMEDRHALFLVLARAHDAAGQPGEAEKARREAAARQLRGIEQVAERVRSYVEQAKHLYHEGRETEATYLAMVATRLGSVMRACQHCAGGTIPRPTPPSTSLASSVTRTSA